MIFGLFGALAATSRSAGGALYTLYTHTDQLAQLIKSPDLIPDALEECLRIASNGYFTFARRLPATPRLAAPRSTRVW